MMGKPDPHSLYSRIRNAVKQLGGTATNKQILKVVGPTIPSARAARAGHHELTLTRKRRKRRQPGTGGTPPKTQYRPDEVVALGRRVVVNVALGNLAQHGHLERLQRGLYRWIEQQSEPTLSDRALALLLEKGALSTEQATVVLAQYVSAEQAVKHYRHGERRHAKLYKKHKPLVQIPLAKQIAHGQRRVVSTILSSLYRRGKITRLQKGVYGPPKPKLFQPDSSTTPCQEGHIL